MRHLNRPPIHQYVEKNIDNIFLGDITFDFKDISFTNVEQASIMISQESKKIASTYFFNNQEKIEFLSNSYNYTNDLFLTLEYNFERFIQNSTSNNFLGEIQSTCSNAAKIANNIYKIYWEGNVENHQGIAIGWLEESVKQNTNSIDYINLWNGELPKSIFGLQIQTYSRLTQQERLMFTLTGNLDYLAKMQKHLEETLDLISYDIDERLTHKTLITARKALADGYRQLYIYDSNDINAVDLWQQNSLEVAKLSKDRGVKVYWLINSLEAAVYLAKDFRKHVSAKRKASSIFGALSKLHEETPELFSKGTIAVINDHMKNIK